MAPTGLDGVVAATTRLSLVDGERGELVIAGFPIAELAIHATFEETTWLLWHGELPSARQLGEFRAELAAQRALPPATMALVRESARAGVHPMDALRMAVDTISLASNEATAIVARCPTIIAAFWRLRRGDEPIAPRADLNHAANLLYMLNGDRPDPERLRALETYLNTVIDHGLNASTFTCRVITSTGSDLVSAVVGAIGALKGPLHGGAPGPALDMVFEIADALHGDANASRNDANASRIAANAPRIDAILRRKIEAGEKLMGFGHRVYRVRDPRADVLSLAAERLYTRAGDMSLYTLARSVEAAAVRLLEEYKPGRRLQTNVEFYTALLLHGLGFDVPLFTPTFAMSRVSGWIAHAFEQRQANRIIRPQSEYSGPRDLTWVPIEQRPEARRATSGG